MATKSSCQLPWLGLWNRPKNSLKFEVNHLVALEIGCFFLREESLLSWWDVTYLTLWSKIWLELVSRLTLINAVTSWLTFVFSWSWRIHFSAADMSYAKAGSYHQVPRDFNVLIQTCSANIQKVTQNSKKTAFPAASSLIMSWIWDIVVLWSS